MIQEEFEDDDEDGDYEEGEAEGAGGKRGIEEVEGDAEPAAKKAKA
jgi:hypothetical protein